LFGFTLQYRKKRNDYILDLSIVDIVVSMRESVAKANNAAIVGNAINSLRIVPLQQQECFANDLEVAL